MKAIWIGIVIAKSDRTIDIEGNPYFPPETLNQAFLSDSQAHTVCYWKGTASYCNIEMDGKTNKDAAWYYPQTSVLAEKIKGFVAFWKGVQVSN